MNKTFAELGICPELCEACESLGWKTPTAIQIATIPPALEGRDIIGLAETGSGKTAAFVLPVLQSLLETPSRLFCVALAPTRELCAQISEQFKALGANIALEVATILGGLDMNSQAMALSKRPHVIVASPGRLSDHIENTKGFFLKSSKFLILDEADRILSMDFDDALNNIIKAMPEERQTFLFSATMTSKVSKLQKASLKNPVRYEIGGKYDTVSGLEQNFYLCPFKYKWTVITLLVEKFTSCVTIVFCNTCSTARKLSFYLDNLTHKTTCLHGKMSQPLRLSALNNFKAGSSNILVTTEVGSRGLDIPSVDLVVNFDVPQSGKDYIHRVGRTARAGRSGQAITLVTQYDVEAFQRVEFALGIKLKPFDEFSEAQIMSKHELCSQAKRKAESTAAESPLKHRKK